MILINNLDFRYKRRKLLFTGLNLELPPGSIIGLLGKNGAGKTSLLKLMSGLLYPAKGSCRLFGAESRLRLPSMLSELYFLPEEIYAPLLKVRDFVATFSPFYPRFSRSEFDGYLREFEVSGDDSLKSMSYGQKKKVLISFALASNCRLLLMDEPTNGLDIPSKSQFRRVIAGAVQPGRSIIISTHQIRDLGLMIDPILILHESRFIVNQTQDEILSRLKFVRTGDATGALYSEETAGIHNAVFPNPANESSVLDIELLFNAAIHTPEIVKLLNSANHE